MAFQEGPPNFAREPVARQAALFPRQKTFPRAYSPTAAGKWSFRIPRDPGLKPKDILDRLKALSHLPQIIQKLLPRGKALLSVRHPENGGGMERGRGPGRPGGL